MPGQPQDSTRRIIAFNGELHENYSSLSQGLNKPRNSSRLVESRMSRVESKTPSPRPSPVRREREVDNLALLTSHLSPSSDPATPGSAPTSSACTNAPGLDR